MRTSKQLSSVNLHLIKILKICVKSVVKCSDEEKCLKLPWLASYQWVKSVCPITHDIYDCCEHRFVTTPSHPSGVPVGLFAGTVASSHRLLSDVMDKVVRL